MIGASPTTQPSDDIWDQSGGPEMRCAEHRLNSVLLPPFTREGHRREVPAEGPVGRLARGDLSRQGMTEPHSICTAKGERRPTIEVGGEDPEGTVPQQFAGEVSFQK